MEKRFPLARYGKRLWTRVLARKIRLELVRELGDLRAGDCLIIDMKNIETFDYSFANELFGRTILDLPRQYPGVFLLVENMSEYARENLENALIEHRPGHHRSHGRAAQATGQGSSRGRGDILRDRQSERPRHRRVTSRATPDRRYGDQRTLKQTIEPRPGPPRERRIGGWPRTILLLRPWMTWQAKNFIVFFIFYTEGSV